MEHDDHEAIEAKRLLAAEGSPLLRGSNRDGDEMPPPGCPLWFYGVFFLAVFLLLVFMVLLSLAYSTVYRHCEIVSRIEIGKPLSECKYYIFVTIPSVIFFYTAFAFHLLRLRPFNQPSLPSKSPLWRYVVNGSFAYILVSQALYQLLVILPNPKLYISAFLVPFALRQSTLFICAFFILKSWWRQRVEPGFVRAYWMVLAIGYVIQYLTFFWRYRPLQWYNILLFFAAIPYTGLVLANFFGSPSTEELVNQRQNSLLSSPAGPAPSSQVSSQANEKTEQKKSINLFRMIVLFAQQLKGKVAWGALISLAAAVLTGLGYAFFEIQALNTQGKILGEDTPANCSTPRNETSLENSYFATTPAPTIPAPPSDVTSTMLYYTLWLVLQDICLAVSKFAAGALRIMVGRGVRCGLVPYLVRNKAKSSHGVYIVNQQCYILDDTVEALLQEVFTPLCQVIFAFIFLVKISLPLTGILLAVSTLYVLFVIGKIFVVIWLSKKTEEINSGISNLAADSLHLLSSVESYVSGWQGALKEYLKLQGWEFLLELTDLLSNSGVLISAIWFGEVYSSSTKAVLTSQQFVSFVLIAETFTEALSECCSAITSFTHSYATVTEVARELQSAKESPKTANPKPATQTLEQFLSKVAVSLTADGFSPSVELDESKLQQIKHLITRSLTEPAEQPVDFAL